MVTILPSFLQFLQLLAENELHSCKSDESVVTSSGDACHHSTATNYHLVMLVTIAPQLTLLLCLHALSKPPSADCQCFLQFSAIGLSILYG